MELRIKDGKYITRNIYLAAVLEMRGWAVDVQPSDRDKDRLDFFVFVDDGEDTQQDFSSRELEHVVNGFFDGSLAVEPRSFGYSIKSVKDRLYTAKSQL